MITVRVPLGERSYDVLVGHGARRELAGAAAGDGQASGRRHPGRHPARRSTLASRTRCSTIGHGEEHKTLATIEALCRGFARMGLTRNDVVDRRRRRHGHRRRRVRRRVVAPRRAGGARRRRRCSAWSTRRSAARPASTCRRRRARTWSARSGSRRGVICDLDALATLPPREVRCGRGEMAKYHFLTGDDLLAMDEAERIARCVEIKAEVVAGDEREGGRRALLNYGHTLAHALEIATDYALAHGEAVAVGLVFAAHLARPLGRIDDASGRAALRGGRWALRARHRRCPPGVDRRAIWSR